VGTEEPAKAKGDTMNVNIHAISDQNFSVSIKDQGETCSLINIMVGGAEITIYLHDGKVDRALHDIDTAIRAFLDNRK
jgi:hypothetical protein